MPETSNSYNRQMQLRRTSLLSLIGRRAVYRAVVAVLMAAVMSHSTTAGESEYLSTGEVVAVGAGSVSVLAVGNYVKHHGSTNKHRWISPLPLEEGISRFFGGEPKLGKRNFLDDRFGAALTTIGAGVLLSAADLAYPPEDRTKQFLQDQFLFQSGAFTTKGITDLVKGLVRRQRPLCYCAADIAAQREEPVQEDDSHAFFSGHASSAFYAMTFLNLRVRSIMRREMSAEDYRNWRWLSPTVAFGWASFVALSRIQAYRHYLSDVSVGAIVGALIATLYYSVAYDPDESFEGASSATPMTLQVTFSF